MAENELLITRLGPKGDGIHLSGRGPIYVERALPGDRIKARVQRDGEGVTRGEILDILEASPHRVPAPCVHYDRCGNCTLQHLKESVYRDWKTEVVREAFHKQGLRPRQWLKTEYVAGQTRRRVTFAALKQRDKIKMGYYRRRSQEISDIDSCLIADPKLLVLREAIKPFLRRILHEGKAADLFLQLMGGAVDLVITGPVGRKGIPDKEVQDAIRELTESSGVTRVSWRPREADDMKTPETKGPVLAYFGPLQVALPPAAFLQPTRAGEKFLVEAVMAAMPAKGKFADLFSGCGTFSGPLLKRGSVDAFEAVLPAVKALSKAGIGQPLKVFRRDLFRNPLRRDEINRYDAIVFDPPRAGCLEQATALASSKTRTLVGVSCNPATFARDARVLCDGGYWLQSVQVVDQFLYSHQVEVVGVFTKGKRTSRS